MAGRCAAGEAAETGGRATTGPAGGLAAMAGAAGGAVTMFGAWRGCGTMRRGAGGSGRDGAGAAGDVAGAALTGGRTAAGVAGAALAVGVGADGGLTAVTAGGGAAWGDAACGRGAGRSASSLRCWIAFRTSPGFCTRDQSIRCAPPLSFFADAEPPLRPLPRWKCARTRCASSPSSELECVFGSVTPTSRSTSRIALLLTSSSLAKSLMRTLLIRPFTLAFACRPSAVHSNLLVCGFTCRPL
jgi:hypothetical protein